ncbi:unnamed protein product, partial [Oikopleura dioica]
SQPNFRENFIHTETVSSELSDWVPTPHKLRLALLEFSKKLHICLYMNSPSAHIRSERFTRQFKRFLYSTSLTVLD